MTWLKLVVLSAHVLLYVAPVYGAQSGFRVVYTDPGITLHDFTLSLTMGAGMQRRGMPGFDYNSVRLQTLLSELSPDGKAAFALGGTASQFMTFGNDLTVPLTGVPFNTPFNISAQNVSDLNGIISRAGMKFVYNANILQRTSENVWDPTNTKEFMDFCIAEGIADNIIFEFTNEPNTLDNKLNITLTAEMVAADFVTFRTILNSEPYKSNFTSSPLLLGPEVSTGGGTDTFLPVFVANINNDTVDCISYHHFYMDGDLATVEDFHDPILLDSFKPSIDSVKSAISVLPHQCIILSAGGSTWGGGTDGLSNAYAAGFMLLDRVGLGFLNGISTILRQSAISGKYALIGDNLVPNSDYYATLLFKRLCGTKVLNATQNSPNVNVRIYAHCTRAEAGYPVGAITLYAMNLGSDEARISFGPKRVVKEYLFEPKNGNVTDREVTVSGTEMRVINDTHVTIPQPTDVADPVRVKIPGLRYAFYVVENPKKSDREMCE